ncbi:hypothetical protein ACFX12_020814 [Malus domestica]
MQQSEAAVLSRRSPAGRRWCISGDPRVTCAASIWSSFRGLRAVVKAAFGSPMPQKTAFACKIRSWGRDLREGLFEKPARRLVQQSRGGDVPLTVAIVSEK